VFDTERAEQPPKQGQQQRHLPIQLTRFIGRETETAKVARLLTGARLVTLAGPGGVGKTRLAIEVAARSAKNFGDAVMLVELAPVLDAALVPQTLAARLRVPELTDEPLLDTLVRALQSKQELIVLDNCEHVTTACAMLAEHLLRTCPALAILATSRELLNVPGEVVWHVPPLPPEDGSILFVERASAAKPGIQLTTSQQGRVTQLCERLDGLPLAIAGQIVWEWRAWEHLDPVEDGIPFPQDARGMWMNGNGICETAGSNLLLSFRNLSTVIEIERASGAIVWKLGAPPLSGQHAPVELANGNILLFDNGAIRADDGTPHSRVIEVDRATKEIVWQYQEHPVDNFFSARISNAQRLPNGNTLINEGVFGRFFEVTREGALVWEYVNPYFGTFDFSSFGQVGTAEVNRVFRAYRYSPAEIERARHTG